MCPQPRKEDEQLLSQGQLWPGGEPGEKAVKREGPERAVPRGSVQHPGGLELPCQGGCLMDAFNSRVGELAGQAFLPKCILAV